MKKVFFVVLAIAGSLFAVNDASAQRVGVFDMDIMVQAMPGYRAVDSLVQMFERDSLGAEYDYSMRDYNILDSTFKRDSADKKPASVLNYVKDRKNQVAAKIIYWQQYSQQQSENKRQMLAGPLYQKVFEAYRKVLETNNYLIILKPGSFELGSKVENIFEKVASVLKIPLPEQLRSGPAEQAEEKQQPANNPANKPAAKPAPKTGKKG